MGKAQDVAEIGMKASRFLREAAYCLHYGLHVKNPESNGWGQFIALTLPLSCDKYDSDDLVNTRVLRFLLAAAVAESEGQ